MRRVSCRRTLKQKMNLPKLIAELQAERDRIDEAILALERLSVANAKRRGRPARWSLPLTGSTEDRETTTRPADSDLIPS